MKAGDAHHRLQRQSHGPRGSAAHRRGPRALRPDAHRRPPGAPTAIVSSSGRSNCPLATTASARHRAIFRRKFAAHRPGAAFLPPRVSQREATHVAETFPDRAAARRRRHSRLAAPAQRAARALADGNRPYATPTRRGRRTTTSRRIAYDKGYREGRQGRREGRAPRRRLRRIRTSASSNAPTAATTAASAIASATVRSFRDGYARRLLGRLSTRRRPATDNGGNVVSEAARSRLRATRRYPQQLSAGRYPAGRRRWRLRLPRRLPTARRLRQRRPRRLREGPGGCAQRDALRSAASLVVSRRRPSLRELATGRGSSTRTSIARDSSRATSGASGSGATPVGRSSATGAGISSSAPRKVAGASATAAPSRRRCTCVELGAPRHSPPGRSARSRAGCRRRGARNTSASSSSTTASPRATTVADRGSPVSSDISPK